MTLTDEEIASRIVRKLHRRGNWGACHTSFKNLNKGFTPRDVGTRGLRRVDNICKALIRKNVIISKPTGYGLEVSLNPKMIAEIKEYLA